MLMQRIPRPATPRYRLRPQVPAMILRCATALFGSYAASAGTAALIARLLPIARVEATLWAMILSFAMFAMLGLWAFHEPRLARVTAVIWGSAIVTGGAAWILGVRP